MTKSVGEYWHFNLPCHARIHIWTEHFRLCCRTITTLPGSWALWAVWCEVGSRGVHILPAIQIQLGLVSGLARLSHVSRSVALSMLGYSCLAHSHWQRCHKMGLQGAVSGEEEAVEKLTRRGPYACPVDLFPQALFLRLSRSPHPSLHCIIHSFARAISARTSDFLKLSASLFPRNNKM